MHKDFGSFRALSGTDPCGLSYTMQLPCVITQVREISCFRLVLVNCPMNAVRFYLLPITT